MTRHPTSARGRRPAAGPGVRCTDVTGRSRTVTGPGRRARGRRTGTALRVAPGPSAGHGHGAPGVGDHVLADRSEDGYRYRDVGVTGSAWTGPGHVPGRVGRVSVP